MRFRAVVFSLLGLALSLTAAGRATAQDGLGSESFESRWTGFYVGVVGGYHAGDINFSNCTGFCPTSPKFNTWGVGFQAGYDHQFASNLVVGGYVNIPIAASKDSFNIGMPGWDFTVSSKFAAHVGGRVGYDFNGVMPYIAGGYSVAVAQADSFFGATRRNTHHGAHVAVGLEYLFAENVSADLRYTFTHLGKRTYDFGGGASRWGENASNFTAAINYRF